MYQSCLQCSSKPRQESQPVHGTATYRCDDTRVCVKQFWPPDDELICSKHVEAWNKLIVKQKFCASRLLITEINILRSTVSKTLKKKKKRKMEFRYCRGRKGSCEWQLTELELQRASRYLQMWFVILTTKNHKHIQAAMFRIAAVSLPTTIMLAVRYDGVLLPLFLYLTLRLTPLHWISLASS